MFAGYLADRMGRDLLGVYHLIEDKIYVYVPVEKRPRRDS